MALSSGIQRKSYDTLVLKYANKLSETDKQLLELVNNIASQNNIPLYLQNQDVLDSLIKHIHASETQNNKNLPRTALLVYDVITCLMESQSTINRSRHLAQGHFDLTPLHLRAIKDQMQDHDMTLSMPQSVGNISVLAVLNRFDPSSANAIKDVLASELFNEEKKHIIIPVGPGHWRGAYITRPSEEQNEAFYDVELFDPYGARGATAIDSYVQELLTNCGIPRELIKLRHSGPRHPQGDAYSCGDFTNAYSHKKMKQYGATKGYYNEILVNTLDNLGNVDNVLRFMTREETRKITEGTARKSTGINDGYFDKSEQVDKTNPSANIPLSSSTPPSDSSAAEKNKQEQTSFSWLKIGSIAIISALGALIGAFVFQLGMALGALFGAIIGACVSASSSIPGLGQTSPTVDTKEPKTITPTASEINSCVDPYNNDKDIEPIICPPLFTKTKTHSDKQDIDERLRHRGP